MKRKKKTRKQYNVLNNKTLQNNNICKILKMNKIKKLVKN